MSKTNTWGDLMRFKQILERNSLGLYTLYFGFLNEADRLLCYPPGNVIVKENGNSTGSLLRH